MRPNFQNATYYRDTITDEESDDLRDLDPEHLESIIGIHSKLLLNDSRGVYIPQNFAELFDLKAWHLEEDSDITCLKQGPDVSEWYWEAWNIVMLKAFWLDEWGNTWRLHQDGDLFAVLEIEYGNKE